MKRRSVLTNRRSTKRRKRSRARWTIASVASERCWSASIVVPPAGWVARRVVERAAEDRAVAAVGAAGGEQRGDARLAEARALVAAQRGQAAVEEQAAGAVEQEAVARGGGAEAARLEAARVVEHGGAGGAGSVAQRRLGEAGRGAGWAHEDHRGRGAVADAREQPPELGDAGARARAVRVDEEEQRGAVAAPGERAVGRPADRRGGGRPRGGAVAQEHREAAQDRGSPQPP